jgi:hypothetical protein
MCVCKWCKCVLVVGGWKSELTVVVAVVSVDVGWMEEREWEMPSYSSQPACAPPLNTRTDPTFSQPGRHQQVHKGQESL